MPGPGVFSPGGCCCPGEEQPTCERCILVRRRCPPYGPIEGATVHVTGPDGYDETAVTDESGAACVPDAVFLEYYDFEVTAEGFASASGSFRAYCSFPGNAAVVDLWPAEVEQCFRVVGCLSGGPDNTLPGATVTIKDGGGSAVASGTADGDGLVCLMIPNPPAPMTIEVTPPGDPPGYVPSEVGPFTFGCPTGSVLDLRPGVDPDYVCACHCPHPIPRTLDYSDDYGSTALEYRSLLGCGGDGWLAWIGCMSISVEVLRSRLVSPYSTLRCLELVEGSAAVWVELSCGPGDAWRLRRFYSWSEESCDDPATIPPRYRLIETACGGMPTNELGCGTGAQSCGQIPIDCELPLNLSIPFAACNNTPTMPGSDGTATITGT